MRFSAVAVVCLFFSAFSAAQSASLTTAEGPLERVSLPGADAASSNYAAQTPLNAWDSPAAPAEAGGSNSERSNAGPGGYWRHVTWEAGGGFTQPNGTASDLMNIGWNARAGAGWNFTPHIGLLAEYEFSRYGWQGPVLSTGSRVNGNVHIWSLTAEPIWRYKITEHAGGYAVVGGGFYRQVTAYGNKVPGTDCNPFFGCYPVPHTNAGSSSSGNQVGANGGVGFTYRTNTANRWAYYIEVRFAWLDTRPETAAFFPVSLGVRW
jgi:opacity protein-like surface antigen